MCTVPLESAIPACNRSRVSRSRSLVGSSSTSKLDARANSRASSSRDRSPPDRVPTLTSTRVGSNRKSFRSEEHTSELQSLMRISYAVFCLKKNINITNITRTHRRHSNTQTEHHIQH